MKTVISDRGFTFNYLGLATDGSPARISESSAATQSCLWLGPKEDGLKYWDDEKGGILPVPEPEDYIKEHWYVGNNIHINREIVGIILLFIKFPKYLSEIVLHDTYNKKFKMMWTLENKVLKFEMINPELKYFNEGWQPRLPVDILSANTSWSYNMNEVEELKDCLEHWVTNMRLPVNDADLEDLRENKTLPSN